MQLKNYNVYFFFIALIGVTVLAYFIIRPFVVPFVIAAILAHLFGFIYKALLDTTQGKRGLSSALACLAIALIIIIPVVAVSFLVVSEVQGIIASFSARPEAIKEIINRITDSLSSFAIIKAVNLEKIINQDAIVSALKSFSQNALVILRGTYRGIAHFIFVSFVMFFSLFYLFIDGEKFVKKIMELSPIKDKYERVLFQKFNSITRATLRGTSLIAIVQGFMGGILFWATGVPSPVLLGILMMISSVIPSVGSGLVWLPVGLLMIIAGHPVEGIAILVVGGLVISTVDNFIRPKMVGRDTQMHPLLILFSTLGGIALFGISGFIVGPIIMSLFVALWEIYALEFKEQLAEFNK